ncbi:MAG: ABC transporter substrate-binding protein [Opitutales bacterium]
MLTFFHQRIRRALSGALVPACLFLFQPLPAGEEARAYERIVSINLSADKLVLQLAEPERIVALSNLATDPELSTLADEASEFPSTLGSAESVLRLEPDIVFSGKYTKRQTTNLLEKTGIRVVRLPVAHNFEECRELIRKVAEILEVEARGEALIQEMNERLARLRKKTRARGFRPTALVYGEGGYTMGDRTLLHHILEAAGFKNHALSFDIHGQAELPLERLLLSPPDFLILLSYYENDPTLDALLLEHRALKNLPDPPHIIHLPLGWTLNGNNLTPRAAEYLWEQSETLLESSKKQQP